MKLLEVNNINKSFNRKIILEEISFSIEEGEIVGLIGKNGVGKSTLMKIIVDLIKADEGYVNICGIPIVEHREEALQVISVLIEGPSLYPELTVKEHLNVNLMLRNLDNKNLQDAYAYLDFGDHLKKKVSKLSLGMKQEVALAICFMNNSMLYILDEPINGLDFDNVMKFRKKLKLLKEQNKSILISSHMLKELEVVADRYLFLENTKVVEVDKHDVSNIEETYEEIVHAK